MKGKPGPGRSERKGGGRGQRAGRQGCLSVLKSKDFLSFYIATSLNLQDVPPIFSMVFQIIIPLITCSHPCTEALRHCVGEGMDPAADVTKLSSGNTREKDPLLFKHAKISQFLLTAHLTGSPRIEFVIVKHTQPTEKGEILRSIENVIVIGAGLYVTLFPNLPVARSRDLRWDRPGHSTAAESGLPAHFTKYSSHSQSNHWEREEQTSRFILMSDIYEKTKRENASLLATRLV